MPASGIDLHSISLMKMIMIIQAVSVLAQPSASEHQVKVFRVRPAACTAAFSFLHF